MTPTMDALGHDVMGRRAAEAWPLARALLLEPPGPEWRPGHGGVIATGVGSSEAHARYLVGLLRQHASVPAWFEPLSAFLDPGFPGPATAGRTLVVFSQGLAANARVALERRRDFASVVVMTSATVAGQERAGRPERAVILRSLVAEGGRVERFPEEDEYAILVRLIGPLCGFAAAWRLASCVRGHSLGTAQDLVEQLDAWAAGPWPHRMLAGIEEALEAHRAGFVVATGPGLGGCAENVVAKFVEGLYWRGPRVVDLLALAHGHLQQLMARPEPVWVLGDCALARRVEEVLAGAGLPARRVPLPGRVEVAPLAAELLLNPVLLGLARRLGVDQVNWPGRNMDGGLYGISRREDLDDAERA